jgi:hypothetical protein
MATPFEQYFPVDVTYAGGYGLGALGICGLFRHQLPSGMWKLTPWRIPEGQRVVTVLVLV